MVEGVLDTLWMVARLLLWLVLVAALAWVAGLLVRWIQNR